MNENWEWIESGVRVIYRHGPREISGTAEGAVLGGAEMTWRVQGNLVTTSSAAHPGRVYVRGDGAAGASVWMTVPERTERVRVKGDDGVVYLFDPRGLVPA